MYVGSICWMMTAMPVMVVNYERASRARMILPKHHVKPVCAHRQRSSLKPGAPRATPEPLAATVQREPARIYNNKKATTGRGATECIAYVQRPGLWGDIPRNSMKVTQAQA